MNLLTDTKVLKLFDYQAVSQTNITTAEEVDMEGFETCLFIVTLGTMVNGSELELTIYQGDTSGALSESDATSGTVTSDGTDDTQILLEVVKPKYRYLEPQLTISTQDAVVENIIAVVGGPREQATDQEDAVISDTLFLSPDNA
jgi:hypothetical protein